MPRFERRDIAEPFFQGSLLMINLTDESKFEAEAFDQAASVLTHQGEDPLYKSGIYIYGLKHIVLGDIVYGFHPDRLQHIHAFEALRRIGVQGKLQSAGTIERYREGGILTRKIYDWSFTLSSEGLLSREDSDNYKFTVIQTALGDLFKIK